MLGTHLKKREAAAKAGQEDIKHSRSNVLISIFKKDRQQGKWLSVLWGKRDREKSG